MPKLTIPREAFDCVHFPSRSFAMLLGALVMLAWIVLTMRVRSWCDKRRSGDTLTSVVRASRTDQIVDIWVS